MRFFALMRTTSHLKSAFEILILRCVQNVAIACAGKNIFSYWIRCWGTSGTSMRSNRATGLPLLPICI